MAAKFIVVVSDRDDDKRGEITVTDDPDRAANLVETLLEAGFDQERIRLFSGDQTEMRVTNRPVVALVDERSPSTATKGTPSVEAAAPRETARKASAAEATPFVKDGVRFSSLFRPARGVAPRGHAAQAPHGMRGRRQHGDAGSEA